MPDALDPLDFITSGKGDKSSRDAFVQLHGAMHSALEEIEKSLQILFEQLKPEGHISDRVILEANSDIRNELSRASGLVDSRRDELLREIHLRLETMFIQALIQSPYKDPSVRKWENLASRATWRALPSISEYSFNDLAVVSKGERRKRLQRWERETDDWLEAVCLNHVSDVIKGLEEEITEYLSSWVESVSGLKRRAAVGGVLFRELIDPDIWTFESDDPTLRNLLKGEQAQDIAVRILSRFQLSNNDFSEIAETVRASVGGLPIYGTNRIGTHELEELLALSIAEKIRATLSVEAGLLSFISNGTQSGEELGELLHDMHRGTSSMEQKLWRVGEVNVGHVDSAAGVGITASSVHDIVLRGLGGGRKFAAVEGHPADNHRFEVQMSIVGAPATDLTIFREMVHAWYGWHFQENRGAFNTEAEWLENVRNECWKLYPDIGTDTGLRNAIIEMIDDDLKALEREHEDPTGHTSNGQIKDRKLIEKLLHSFGPAAPVSGR